MKDNFRKKYQKHDALGPILKFCDFVAVYPARFFLRFKTTPNQITVMGIVAKIIGALLVSTASYPWMIVGLLLFYFGSILDGSDGVVARYRKIYSLNGIYLDHFCHYFCNSFLIFCLSFAWVKITANPIHFIPASIGIFSLLLSKSLTINPQWFGDKKQKEQITKIISSKKISLKNQNNILIVYLFDFLRIENPFNLMFWSVVFGFVDLVLWVYALFLFLEMARKLLMQLLAIQKSER